jgi:RHS repeat-associated protein
VAHPSVLRVRFLTFLWARPGSLTSGGISQENDYNTSCVPEFRFAGMEYDSETGNYYDNARYYNPFLGKFMSPDPANAGAVPSNPQSWNAYAYVGNNPETLTDPDGRHQVCGDSSYSTDPQTGALIVNANCYDAPDNLWWGLWDAFTLIPRGAEVAFANIENLIPPLPIQLPHLDPATMTAIGAVAGMPEGAFEGVASSLEGEAGSAAEKAAASGARPFRSLGAAGARLTRQLMRTTNMTAEEAIAAFKQGSILREFPSQYLRSTLDQIEAAKQEGVPGARRALKLLFDARFDK